MTVTLLAAWIYLVFMTLKKKTNLFHDHMEPELAERRLKRLRKFLLAAGVSVAAFIPVTLYAAIVDPSEEGTAFAVVFSILVFCALLFHIGAIGGLVIFLKGRECWQSAQMGQIRTREDYYYEEPVLSSLRVLL